MYPTIFLNMSVLTEYIVYSLNKFVEIFGGVNCKRLFFRRSLLLAREWSKGIWCV